MPRDPRLWDLTKGASKLNAHRDEVLSLYWNRVSLAAIGARFGMAASGVLKWIRENGGNDRVVICELPECEQTFPFNLRQRYCSRLHVRRANARARNQRPEERQKNRARGKLHQAVYSGRVERPLHCERCGERPESAADGRSLVQADHHRGYDDAHALDVWWICKVCDVEVEKLRAEGKTINKDNPCG